MSTLAPAFVGFSTLRDSRHRSARAAREVSDWLSWLELEGKAPRTISDYEWVVARLLRTFMDTELAEFTDGDIAQVLRTFPQRSRRERQQAFKSLFKWAKRTRRILENPMDYLPEIRRQGQRAIDIFTDIEIAALTALEDSHGDLFLILFDTGLRQGEARNLRVRDCNLGTGELVVLRSKGDKDRVVPLTARLIQRLSEWFLVDALHPDDYLWAVRPGGYYVRRTKPMGETSFKNWYRDCLKTAGVRYRKPHTTRHTFATRWLRMGGRLETVSRALGHSSIRTTADLYAHLDLRDLRADLEIIERGS